MTNNGNRYIIDTEGINHELDRDLDKIFIKYKNLRYALYNRYASQMDNYVKKEELLEYINEQFIKLVKEYDIHSDVDFPYYIKSKLTMRVRNSYVKKNRMKESNMVLGHDDTTLESIIESNNSLIRNSDVLEYLFDNTEFTYIESELLKRLLNDCNFKDDSDIVAEVSLETEESRKDVAKILSDLKYFIKKKLEYYETENKTQDIVKGRVNRENNVWEL